MAGRGLESGSGPTRPTAARRPHSGTGTPPPRRKALRGALLPAAAVKAAIDCAFADALICLEPSSSQDKADTLRRMMEGQP